MVLPRSPLIVAVVFSFAALGALVLVVVNLAVGRPVAGDLFIAGLNGAAAVVRIGAIPPQRPRNARSGIAYRALAAGSVALLRGRPMRTSSWSPSGNRRAPGQRPISCQPHDL